MSIIYARKPTRLKEYDYSRSGYYYVTICTENREQIFGTIENNDIILNGVGNLIDQWWQKMFEKYDDISIDKYIIMPNHIHGIINIAVGATPCSRPIPCNRPIKNNKNHTIKGENTVSPLRKISNQYNGLGQYISWFKRMTTNKYIYHVKTDGWKSFNKRLWQRNYYDHIIRNEKSLQEIREYIMNNPATWVDDENNIENCKAKDYPFYGMHKKDNYEQTVAQQMHSLRGGR